MIQTFTEVSNREFINRAKQGWAKPKHYVRPDKPIERRGEVRRLANGRYASQISEEIQRSQDRQTIAIIEVKDIWIKNKRGLKKEIATWLCDWCESENAGDQFTFKGKCFCSKKCVKLFQINKI